MRIALALVALAALHARPAAANSACRGENGWSPSTGDTVPRHASLVYWSDRGVDASQVKVVARIDGTAVKTTVTQLASAPYTMLLVKIESDRAGKLEIGLDGAYYPSASFVVGSPHYGAAHATTARYHHKLAHSTVREVFDGLLIGVDVPAVRAHVKLRRDAKADWSELDVPVTSIDGNHTLRIGELGCQRNYTPELLEAGVDLDVALFLPDGSQIELADLTRAAIPKLAHPTSNLPTDSE